MKISPDFDEYFDAYNMWLYGNGALPTILPPTIGLYGLTFVEFVTKIGCSPAVLKLATEREQSLPNFRKV